MTDDLRARIAEAIGQHCPDHYEHHWEAAADAILAFIQPELDERDARIRYWQDSRESYARESRKLIVQRNELRTELRRHETCRTCGHERHEHAHDSAIRADYCGRCTTDRDVHGFQPEERL